jgi:hypothetical protein
MISQPPEFEAVSLTKGALSVKKTIIPAIGTVFGICILERASIMK